MKVESFSSLCHISKQKNDSELSYTFEDKIRVFVSVFAFAALFDKMASSVLEKRLTFFNRKITCMWLDFYPVLC